MALNFPSSPAPNQVYTAEGMTFIWNGTVWLLASSEAIPFATEAEALAGTSTDTVMSPATTAAVAEPFAGRNLIINGRGLINQRSYASGAATTAANQYTLDRWRVVVSGQSLSWTDEVYRKLMVAPAGGVEQPIENLHIEGGQYTINWEGTATCTVNSVARAKGEVWGISPGVTVPVRFINGTFTDVQLERANRPTTYESRLAPDEVSLCERYLERCTGACYGYLNSATGSFIGSIVNFRTTKRITPTVTSIGNQALSNVSSPYPETITPYGFRAMAQSTASGQGGFSTTFLVDAEITA